MSNYDRGVDWAFRPDGNVYIRLLEMTRAKVPAALATIVGAEGSTPQVAGASALFTADGLVSGTVGGGFVEARVEREARVALRTGTSRLRSFDLSDHLFEEADGVCGGTLRVLIDANPASNGRVFQNLVAAVQARRLGILATLIVPGRAGSARIERYWIPEPRSRTRPKRGRPWISDKDKEHALSLIRPDLVRKKNAWLYLEPIIPRPQLVIAGAGHVGRAVAHLGRLLDFEVIVLDDRPEFANPARFPDAGRIMVGNIAASLRGIRISTDTYIVIVTRGHRSDEEALRAVIRRRPAYLGMIGSRRKVDLMRSRFLKNDWASAAAWDRLHAPIGLPVGSRTIEEIAVSIAAELVQVRSRTRTE